MYTCTPQNKLKVAKWTFPFVVYGSVLWCKPGNILKNGFLKVLLKVVENEAFT